MGSSGASWASGSRKLCRMLCRELAWWLVCAGCVEEASLLRAVSRTTPGMSGGRILGNVGVSKAWPELGWEFTRGVRSGWCHLENSGKQREGVFLCCSLLTDGECQSCLASVRLCAFVRIRALPYGKQALSPPRAAMSPVRSNQAPRAHPASHGALMQAEGYSACALLGWGTWHLCPPGQHLLSLQ